MFQERGVIALRDVRKILVDYYGMNPGVPRVILDFIEKKQAWVKQCPRCWHEHAADGLNCGADLGNGKGLCECDA